MICLLVYSFMRLFGLSWGSCIACGLRIRIGRARILASIACGSWKDTLCTKAKFEMVLKGRPCGSDRTGAQLYRTGGLWSGLVWNLNGDERNLRRWVKRKNKK